MAVDGVKQLDRNNGVSKLGQLVQEKDASVAQGYLSRPGQATSAYQPSVRFNV